MALLHDDLIIYNDSSMLYPSTYLQLVLHIYIYIHIEYPFLLLLAVANISDVKVLGIWASPFVNRVQFALNLKSTDYEFIKESFVPKSDLLLKSNPVYKKVPVFFHADKPISESLVILQYIDEVWTNGPPILPSDPCDCAIARFWAAYIDDKLFSALMELIITAKGKEAKTKALEQTVEAIGVLEAAFWDCSKGKPYFSGDKIGYLDIALGCLLGWMRLAEKVVVAEVKLLCETKTPGLVGWAERFCSNDAIKGVIQDPEKLMDTYNLLKSKNN